MIKLISNAHGSQQFSEVEFFVTRADGRIGHCDSRGRWVNRQHRQRYQSLGFRIGRLVHRVRKALPFIGVLWLLATRSTHALHEFFPSLPSGGAGVSLAATVVVNGGQAINTNLVSGLGGTVPKFVAWGTGAGTAGVTDTTLFTETADEARTSGTVTRQTTTVTNDTLQVVGSITVLSNNKTITNVGLFDVVTSSTPNLYIKADFTGQALLIGDSITFTIKNKFA